MFKSFVFGCDTGDANPRAHTPHSPPSQATHLCVPAESYNATQSFILKNLKPREHVKKQEKEHCAPFTEVLHFATLCVCVCMSVCTNVCVLLCFLDPFK